jgi:hypothetical protein
LRIKKQEIHLILSEHHDDDDDDNDELPDLDAVTKRAKLMVSV